jgi:hypothetical protein
MIIPYGTAGLEDHVPLTICNSFITIPRTDLPFIPDYAYIDLAK